MSMISELVDRLRTESKSMGKYGTDYMATLLMQASATIIMLSEKAKADRPQGEWKSNHNGYWTCSECGLSFLFYAKGNFCPNCGADMTMKKADGCKTENSSEKPNNSKERSE